MTATHIEPISSNAAPLSLREELLAAAHASPMGYAHVNLYPTNGGVTQVAVELSERKDRGGVMYMAERWTIGQHLVPVIAINALLSGFEHGPVIMQAARD